MALAPCLRTLLRRKWHTINPKMSGCCNRNMPFITPCCTCRLYQNRQRQRALLLCAGLLAARIGPTTNFRIGEAQRPRLNQSFGCILALCKQWLDTPLPCSVPALDTDTVEKFAAVILGGGVFGHGNGNTGAVFLARQKAADGSKTPFTRFVALFRYCFPKADYMAYQFPYLIRRPCLLPFAYLHRFCRGLFRNRTHSAALQAIAGKNQGTALLHQVWAELDL